MSVKRNKKVSVACVHCAKSHVTCDDNRPCTRCIRKGLEESCIDAPRKKVKYLRDVPEDQLPSVLRSTKQVPPVNAVKLKMEPGILPNIPLDYDGGTIRQSAPANNGKNNPETQQTLSNGQITHRPKFLSSAADLEYSILSDIIHGDSLFNKIPVNFLYSNPTEKTPSPINQGSLNGQQDLHFSLQLRSKPMNQIRGNTRAIYSNLLGPVSHEILQSEFNLYTNHFPLQPQESLDGTLDFKRMTIGTLSPHLTKFDKTINQYYLNFANTFPEIYDSRKIPNLSYALEVEPPEYREIPHDTEIPHTLRFTTPSEIYSLVQTAFPSTTGFHALLRYLKRRFDKNQLVEMCRCLAELRPIFIASTIDLTDEDMIFMEKSHQRTLLEYEKFISQVGTPTCVWRRNGQISYVNDEFSLLTGWNRLELLNKMTFIVELMDGDTVMEYFQTFTRVAYQGFRGAETMRICNLLTPIKGSVIKCCCLWTLKRDAFGLPMMIIGNFMPILTLPEDVGF
ncbi:Ert1p [Kluyveromyces lactis]|uniref:Transcription activator of gluconeogenesis ERT1 n=1 Tax=Kluyveromyces lactis (strain ATCC 8585 / CBS 2359 / DSM 70799 / NBRC 1267 / NRRL Y-1140 / WM37) TaxID=284590 RepID=ERT1_KLULA|nr:uncharacterized protein KLLA0_F10417g [Kluyveromyces lactis]Q6CKI5.1 RecName: Full=Transcription activator of gluconeogenesis ERT1 [Kluyveromyces lactis NRRL Y-1140]CAG98262.1 KLLA0F10417p [Kluyveromyces lactis]|eukprot:XP_455554.1 uncharacterized protein KLLA0_F10417g [Kluyveromyces lactis]